jgi:uncharacterized protein
MSSDTARKCVEFALKNLPEGKRLDLCFFGGEPLLRFDLIREITEYSYKRSAEEGIPIQIGITTNGTLVTSEIIDFVSEQRINLCFSIDGPRELHDSRRSYLHGSGSFADTFNKLMLALKRLDTVEVNAVFGPDTIKSLPRCLKFFLDSGVSVIHFNPDITASWPDELNTGLHDIFSQVAEFYIDSYNKGQEVAVNLIDSKLVLFIKGGYSPGDMCAMGDGEWGFSASGNIYPCERFIGTDENSYFCLGNIHTGLDLTKRCALRSRRGNNDPNCSNCSLKKYCMNWCGCTNYFMSGQTDMPAPVLCAMEQGVINAAKYTFDSLVKADNELFMDHLYTYINADVHHR